jgi:hypothetical protein
MPIEEALDFSSKVAFLTAAGWLEASPFMPTY